ncbi:MAG: hypothetical protein U0401_20550 [Anaerolineae bacterium]
MEQTKTYECFPFWMVGLSNLVTVSIYGFGAYILSGFGLWLSGLYLLYCLGLELRLLQRHCINCYYYGKVCGFGKGKLCAWLFKKGDPRKFNQHNISWAGMLPDFLVLLGPVLGGIILLLQNFTWLLVGALALLIVLSTSGNAMVRGSRVCKYCRQKEFGCPAAKLFGVEKSCGN